MRAVRCFFDYRERGPCSPFGATLVQLALANEAAERSTPKAFVEIARTGGGGDHATPLAPLWTRVRSDGVHPPVGRAFAHWQSHWPSLAVTAAADPSAAARTRHGRRLVGGEARRRQRAEAALAVDESVVPCHSWVPPADRQSAQ